MIKICENGRKANSDFACVNLIVQMAERMFGTDYVKKYLTEQDVIFAEAVDVRTEEVIMRAKWLIWSKEHRSFWAPNGNGYTWDVSAAGRYTFRQAFKICKDANLGSESGYPHGRAVEEVMCPSPEMIMELKKNEK